MRTRFFFARAAAFPFLAFAMLFSSCSEEEARFSEEALYAVEEVRTDAYYADVDDMAGVAMSESEEADGIRTGFGARQMQVNDDRFCLILVELDLDLSVLPLLPVGNITLDFGTGCEDALGNVRKGRINVHFRGRRFRPGSWLSLSFENYEINGISLNGTRTLTNLPGSTILVPQFQIELVNGSVDWSDGRSATRNHCFVSSWRRGVAGGDQLTLAQCAEASVAATGENSAGIAYTMEIEEPLIYRRGCPIAASGVKRFTETGSGKQIIIDYGSGTCDASITITVDGNIHTVNSR